jgi:two-component system response regulator MprA
MTEPAKVIIAEDDRAIRESIARLFGLEGYDVRAVDDGAAALAAHQAQRADVLLLDVMMPVLDGLSTCRALRAMQDNVPILMLTAKSQTSDRVEGLDAGADDYLAKPFAVDELLARVRALLRRGALSAAPANESALNDSEELTYKDLKMSVNARRVWRGETEVQLSKTEFDLLELLLRNAGIVLDHSMIYDRIWGYDFGPESKNLAMYVSYLRRKIDVGDAEPLIQTVRGVGYSLRVG